MEVVTNKLFFQVRTLRFREVICKALGRCKRVQSIPRAGPARLPVRSNPGCEAVLGTLPLCFTITVLAQQQWLAEFLRRNTKTPDCSSIIAFPLGTGISSEAPGCDPGLQQWVDFGVSGTEQINCRLAGEELKKEGYSRQIWTKLLLYPRSPGRMGFVLQAFPGLRSGWGGGQILSAESFSLMRGGWKRRERGKTACVLSLPFVLTALPAWNTAQGKFPDREICRLQGPGGGPGPRLFGAAAGKRGWVSRSGAGGRQPAFPAVKELALGASGADSFLSRAGGPRDRSPLSGLGGERPKRKGGREEGAPRRYLLLWGSACRAEHQIRFC